MRHLALRLVVTAIVSVTASASSATVNLGFRSGATDVDFRFVDGLCTPERAAAFVGHAIAPTFPGHNNIPSVDGAPTCANGVARVNFKNVQGADPATISFFNLFYSTDPALKDFSGNKVNISSAWWTPWEEGRYPIFGGLVLGVPEPSVWVYMIVGFGVIGGSARSRRTARPEYIRN